MVDILGMLIRFESSESVQLPCRFGIDNIPLFPLFLFSEVFNRNVLLFGVSFLAERRTKKFQSFALGEFSVWRAPRGFSMDSKFFV